MPTRLARLKYYRYDTAVDPTPHVRPRTPLLPREVLGGDKELLAAYDQQVNLVEAMDTHARTEARLLAEADAAKQQRFRDVRTAMADGVNVEDVPDREAALRAEAVKHAAWKRDAKIAADSHGQTLGALLLDRAPAICDKVEQQMGKAAQKVLDAQAIADQAWQDWHTDWAVRRILGSLMHRGGAVDSFRPTAGPDGHGVELLEELAVLKAEEQAVREWRAQTDEAERLNGNAVAS